MNSNIASTLDQHHQKDNQLTMQWGSQKQKTDPIVQTSIQVHNQVRAQIMGKKGDL